MRPRVALRIEVVDNGFVVTKRIFQGGARDLLGPRKKKAVIKDLKELFNEEEAKKIAADLEKRKK